MWTRAMVLGATAGLLLLVACGDDSSDGNTGGSGGTGTGGTMTGGGGSGGTAAGGTGSGGSLPDGSCRDETDCDSDQEYCLAPGDSMACGMCYTPFEPCQTDDECTDQGAHYICEVPGCACDSTKECQEGCLDGQSCGEAQVCGADHRCEPQPCSADQPCPDNFGCSGSSTCVRRSCQDDSDCLSYCVHGECYCVHDQCYGQLGSCELSAA